MKKITRIKKYMVLDVHCIDVYTIGGECCHIREDQHPDDFFVWDALKKGDSIDVDSSQLPIRIRSYKGN